MIVLAGQAPAIMAGAPFQITTDRKERPDGWVVFGSTTTTTAKRDEVASPHSTTSQVEGLGSHQNHGASLWRDGGYQRW
jgi:hypothetical protein